MDFSFTTANIQIRPPATPITILPIGPTHPHAGVMATRPATAPDAAPNIVGLPRIAHSPKVQANTAAAVARKVLMKTCAAKALASRLEPTLNPNQPTHSKAAPTIVKGTLCGARDWVPKPLRLPINKQPTK